MEYSRFLTNKRQLAIASGFSPVWMPDYLFDFQKYVVEKSLMRGRSAIFADCGLGKTPMLLVWSENVRRKTNGNVLILTPLAVSIQIAEEASRKFGIEVHHCKDGKPKPGINVSNYEKIHLFDPNDFQGVVCDESSKIKAMTGKLRHQVTIFMRKVKYRLLDTATAAPNDYVELGTSSEALGHMGQRDMLSNFFKSADNLSHTIYKHGDFWNKQQWTFRPHAEDRFWQWVVSWSMALRKPSDLGFDDSDFKLPELKVVQHLIDKEIILPGEFLPRIATGLKDQRHERRHTMTERVEKVCELVANHESSLVWCHLNDEGDMIEKSIPGAYQVAGSTPDDLKEELLMAFTRNEIKVLVSKPQIAGFGMNWQHCNHMTFFPSHSFEQYYQAVRRCWRFGQQNPVTVDIVTTPGEAGVTANLNKKSEAASKMFESLVAFMGNQLSIDRNLNNHEIKMEIASWLK